MTSLSMNSKGPASFAQSRFARIAPLVELLSIPASYRFPHLLPDGKRAQTWTETVAWCAVQSGRHVRTISRDLALFKEGSEGALLSHGRKDKGVSRFFARHSKATAFAAYLRLAWQQTFLAIHKAILRDGRLLEISAEEMPCYETVRGWFRSIPSDLVALALEGQKAHRERVSSYAKRGLLTVRKDRSV